MYVGWEECFRKMNLVPFIEQREREREREREGGRERGWKLGGERGPDFFLSRLIVINLSPVQFLSPSNLALLMDLRGSRWRGCGEKLETKTYPINMPCVRFRLTPGPRE